MMCVSHLSQSRHCRELSSQVHLHGIICGIACCLHVQLRIRHHFDTTSKMHCMHGSICDQVLHNTALTSLHMSLFSSVKCCSDCMHDSTRQQCDLQVISTALGYVLPNLISRQATQHAATALYTFFGLRLLWIAWRSKPQASNQVSQHEPNRPALLYSHDRVLCMI